MTQEQVEKMINSEPQLQFFIRGIRVSDGVFFTDAAVGFSRDDIREESKKYIKYVLYDLTKSKNQNL